MTAIGEKIHQMRLKNSLTLEQLAAKIGTTKSHVWALENTAKNYSAKKLHAIALALGVSVEFFMDDAKSEPQEHQIDEAFFHRYQRLAPEAKVQMRKILATFEGEQ